MRSAISGLLLTVFGAAALAGCGSNGGGAPVEVRAVAIDQGGGTIEVSEGLLEGLSLTIPPGSFEDPTLVTLLEGFAVLTPGFRNVSAGAIFTPDMTPLVGEPTLTMPINSAATRLNEATILFLEGNRIIEVAPVTVDSMAETVTGTVPALATFWVGERYLGGFITERDGSSASRDFLPLNDGDVWNFDNGITITTEATSTEPNLNGANVFKFTIATAEESLGFYLQRSTTNTAPDATRLLGYFSNTDGATFQRIHAERFLLPARVTIGQLIRSVYPVTLYRPFGSTNPTAVEQSVFELLPTRGDIVVTPVATFEDRLRMDYTIELTDDLDEVTTIRVGITFAAGAGPIAVTVFGLEALLQSGTVGGSPVSV